jgi:hypothetical protein
MVLRVRRSSRVLGFVVSLADLGLFYKRTGSGAIVCLLTYVDDLLICSSDPNQGWAGLIRDP